MKNVGLSIIAALSLASAGCLPYDHYQAGVKAMNVREYAKARTEFTKVVQGNYRFQSAQFMLGMVMYATHDVNGALQQMLKARNLGPEAFEKDTSMRRGLGMLYGELTRQWQMPTDGIVESVTTVGDVMLIVGEDGSLSAHRQDKVLWENAIGKRGNYGQAVPVSDGELVYVVKDHTPDHKLLALKLETGETVWSHDIVSNFEFANAAVGPNAVYVGEETRGKNRGFKLLALDKHSGQPIWEAPLSGMAGTIAADGAHVCTYTQRDHVQCVAANNGSSAIDFEVSAPGVQEQTAMVLTDHNVYLSIKDTVYALQFAATPLAWKHTLQGGGLSAVSLVAGGTKLVVQSRGALSAFDASSGAPAWVVNNPAEDGAWKRSGQRPIEIAGTVVGWGRSDIIGVTEDGRLSWQLAIDGSLSAAPISPDGNTLVLAVHGTKAGLIANTPRNLFN